MIKKLLWTIARACLFFLFALPVPTFAFTDFGGWVMNIPGAPGSIKSAGALPTFPPPYGVSSFWYPVGGGCLNGVQEVNLRSPTKGRKSPKVLLQFRGAYTFSAGPARLINQSLIGKYVPAMVCMANFVSWIPCAPPGTLCPKVIPKVFYKAPLIIYNGSSRGPAL